MMRHGYYYLDSKFWNFLKRAQRWTQFVYAEAYDGAQGDRNYYASSAQMVESLDRIASAGLKIHLNMQWGPDSWEETLTSVRPYWDAVELLDLTDEPGYPKARVQQEVLALKALVRSHGLPSHPVGAVFGTKQILSGTGWKAPALDWIGCELYLPGSVQGAFAEPLEDLATALFGALPPKKPLVVVIQAWDRDDAWRAGNLQRLQEPAYRIACADSRVLWIRWFHYGYFAKPDHDTDDQGGGVYEHKALRQTHKRLVGLGLE